MKIAALYLLVLFAIVAATMVVGHGLTEQRWGAAGVRSMWAAAAIGLAAATMAVVPLPWMIRYQPDQLGYAIFAGTAIRLLVTLILSVVYQATTTVDLSSFLPWLFAIYTLLLAAETGMGVTWVRKTYRRANHEG